MTSPAQKMQAAEPKEDSPASTNDVIEDLESQAVGPSVNTWQTGVSDSTKESPVPSDSTAATGCKRKLPNWADRCRRRGRSTYCMACLAVFLVMTACVAAVIWPRHVDWKVTEIAIDDGALTGLIGAMMSPEFNSTAGIGLDAVVQAENKNMIGARVGEGQFVITKGVHTLAVVKTKPMVARRQGTAVIEAHSVSSLTPEISRYLLETLPPKYAMTVVATGELPASVWGISFMIHVDCEVDVSVLMILRPEREATSSPGTVATTDSAVDPDVDLKQPFVLRAFSHGVSVM
eukprot:CAMPEP_0176025676 /NCGR_PEP_ID=MMETSP0120_2-20121206/12565_1 /TAXON_ID=160619 /ORGANISM="Kryptoperidinium foliaceum, Strain CCMP 1326" /LENGTH=289 /DNA_ID=CAMNT_0017358863 /DNA_START=62 /DNA_END=932 /DNA_ORIENTATION=+